MTEPPSARRARPPLTLPRWLVRTIWSAHRAIHRMSRGRLGLRTPADGALGMMRLRTIGRRSGEERGVILVYLEDGERLVTLAMNGWADPEPAWWLNLQAEPEAVVELTTGERRVRARAAEGAERERLWEELRHWRGYGDDLDASAALRSGPTAVVVLEPR